MRAGSSSPSIAAVRLLIVDDHAGFRASARALLEAGGLTVVGEVGDGGGAVAAVERLRPDVVLLDVQLPDIDGFEVAVQLAAVRPPPTIILTSSRDARTYGARVETSPARGFIPKAEVGAERIRDLLRSRDDDDD